MTSPSSTPSSRLTAKIERAVRLDATRYALWTPGASLVVGVSGGADSLCLLGVLHALSRVASPVAPGRLIVAHLDHGLRGEDGQRDAAWVAEFAQSLGLPCILDAKDVRELARRDHRSLEDAARRARYSFLRLVAVAEDAERICVGHTRDDQAETVIMRLLRGSGVEGLAGMRPLQGVIARPLLGLYRPETEAYCAAKGWQPLHDHSNDDLTFTRNRIRHELLPILTRYNPHLMSTLSNNASLIASDDDYLEDATSAAWRSVPVEESVGRASVALVPLLDLPPALRHRGLRRIVERLTAGEHVPEARHLLALDALLARRVAGLSLDLPGHLRVSISYDALHITQQTSVPALPTPAACNQPLAVPGEVDLPRSGWKVRAWITDRPAGLEAANPAPPPAWQPFPRTGTRADLGKAELRAYLDADLAGEPLSVRTWAPGDRFQPLGMERTKKLQDYFADAKVPRELRSHVPLVVGPRHILWIGGQRIDERARISPATRRVLVLQLEPLVV
jgi:tRNA(Ile)-lysidine synthase